MKAAIFVGGDWLVHEQPTLRRLVIGLVDESVRVMCVTPEVEGAACEPLTFTTEQLSYPSSRWAWIRDRQIRLMGDRLQEADIDVIHAMDGSLQGAVLSLARQLQLPVVCSIWSEAETLEMRVHDPAVNGLYTAASTGLAQIVRRQIGPSAPLECLSPGVYCSAAGVDPPLAHPAESLSCMVIGNGRYDEHYEALLGGLCLARGDLPAAMFFFFTIDADQHRLWQAAEARDLHECVTLVPRGADIRPMLMRADVLIQPQPLRTVRTVVLEAMASARPVIAMADPTVDHLVDGVCARVVSQADPTHWATSLRQLAGGPKTFVKLGESARQHVLDHYKASAYVDGVRRCYEKVVTPQTIPFGA